MTQLEIETIATRAADILEERFMKDGLYSSSQIQKKLGISRSTLWVWRKKLKMECMRTDGGHLRFTHSEYLKLKAC